MVKPTTSTVAVLAAAAVALLATSGLAIEIYDSKAADNEDGTTAVQFSGDRTARFGITDRTTTVTV
jgi:signal transduction histidine kinase